MRIRTSIPAALAICTAGLGVAACSAAGTGSSSGGPVTTPTVTTTANPGSTVQAAAGTPTPASTQEPVAASSGTKCQPANLSFTLGATIKGASTTQVVNLTNQGSSACTMEGFPGVDLVGVANGQQNYTWPLVRASVTNARESHQGISKVTLQPGGIAHFDLRYLPGAPGDHNNLITVVKMVITPPNDYTQGQMTWDQDVVLQDAATHPGTFILPVVSGP
jgi:Protein of unknown function (DUF4232)